MWRNQVRHESFLLRFPLHLITQREVGQYEEAVNTQKQWSTTIEGIEDRGMAMCRWLAYSGNAITLSDLIFDTEHSLVDQSLSGPGPVWKQPTATVSALAGTTIASSPGSTSIFSLHGMTRI